VAEQCTKVPDSVLREVLTHGSSAGMLHTVHTHASKLQDDTEEQLTAEDRDEAARWGCSGCCCCVYCSVALVLHYTLSA
jgi:hypothetical protein